MTAMERIAIGRCICYRKRDTMTGAEENETLEGEEALDIVLPLTASSGAMLSKRAP
jgi:hypothetical protein